MNKLLKVLMSGLFIFGSTVASATDTDSHRLMAQNNVAKSDQTIKSNKQKVRASKVDRQFSSESRAEDETPLTRKEVEEMREALGEK